MGLTRSMCDVLLLDDDVVLRQLIADALGEVGLRTEAAATVRDATEILDRTPDIPVLIVDHDLGPMDLSSGFAFGRAALARPQQPGVIYMTAQWNNYERYRPGPRERHLPKPFRLAELLLVVRDLMALRPAIAATADAPSPMARVRALGTSQA